MINNKEYNKSTYFDCEQSPKFKFSKRLSSDADKEKFKAKAGLNSISNKLRQIEKNKFRNIPKNEGLMDCSSIHRNDTNHNRRSNKDKTCYKSFLSGICQNELDTKNLTNIKKKLNDSNMKVSSLIPISKKKRSKQSKMKTIKEKENTIINILNKKIIKCRRKYSCGDDKVSKNSKNNKKKETKYNSSNSLVKLKAHKRLYNNRYTDLNVIRHILKEEEKTKIVPKKESNKKISDKKNNNKDQFSTYICNNNNIRDSKLSKLSKISGNRSNKNSTKKVNFYLNDDKNEKKHYHVNKEENKVEINHAKTKNECDIINISNKAKKKKCRGFPFCCLTVKDGDSSEEN